MNFISTQLPKTFCLLSLCRVCVWCRLTITKRADSWKRVIKQGHYLVAIRQNRLHNTYYWPIVYVIFVSSGALSTNSVQCRISLSSKTPYTTYRYIYICTLIGMFGGATAAAFYWSKTVNYTFINPNRTDSNSNKCQPSKHNTCICFVLVDLWAIIIIYYICTTYTRMNVVVSAVFLFSSCVACTSLSFAMCVSVCSRMCVCHTQCMHILHSRTYRSYVYTSDVRRVHVCVWLADV